MMARILLVSSLERRPRLLELLLKVKELEIELAAGIGEAQLKLSTPICWDILFVDTELSDGSWLDLVQHVLDSPKTCEVIVCSRLVDARLWAEVIQCGAFDLIAEPYEEVDVLRIVESALNSQYIRKFSQTKAARAFESDPLPLTEFVAQTVQ